MVKVKRKISMILSFLILLSNLILNPLVAYGQEDIISEDLIILEEKPMKLEELTSKIDKSEEKNETNENIENTDQEKEQEDEKEEEITKETENDIEEVQIEKVYKEKDGEIVEVEKDKEYKTKKETIKEDSENKKLIEEKQIEEKQIEENSDLNIKEVETEEGLKTALEDLDIEHIYLTKEIVLSGSIEINRDIIIEGNGEQVKLISANNSRHFKVGGDDLRVKFKNIIFKGNADKDIYGGGIEAEVPNGLLEIENSTFINNSNFYAGGAINITGNLKVSNNVVFKENIVTDTYKFDMPEYTEDLDSGFMAVGGAIALFNGNLEVSDSVEFIENEVEVKSDKKTAMTNGGGAIFIEAGNAEINNDVKFESNKCVIRGNYYYGANTTDTYGGAIYLLTSSSDISDGVEFNNNSVYFDYLGESQIFLQGDLSGGAIYINDSNLKLRNNIKLEGNKSYKSGGAICSKFSDLLIDENVEIKENISNEYGGAIYLHGGNIKLTNNVSLYKNRSTGPGGAVYLNYGYIKINNDVLFKENNSGWEGGTIYITNSYLDIDNACFTNNTNKDIYIYLFELFSDSDFSEEHQSYSNIINIKNTSFNTEQKEKDAIVIKDDIFINDGIDYESIKDLSEVNLDIEKIYVNGYLNFINYEKNSAFQGESYGTVTEEPIFYNLNSPEIAEDYKLNVGRGLNNIESYEVEDEDFEDNSEGLSNNIIEKDSNIKISESVFNSEEIVILNTSNINIFIDSFEDKVLNVTNLLLDFNNSYIESKNASIIGKNDGSELREIEDDLLVDNTTRGILNIKYNLYNNTINTKKVDLINPYGNDNNIVHNTIKSDEEIIYSKENDNIENNIFISDSNIDDIDNIFISYEDLDKLGSEEGFPTNLLINNSETSNIFDEKIIEKDEKIGCKNNYSNRKYFIPLENSKIKNKEKSNILIDKLSHDMIGNRREGTTLGAIEGINDLPVVDTPKEEDKPKEDKPSGGGSSRRKRKNKEKEDEDKKEELKTEDNKLNKDDHIKYIQGYLDNTIRPNNNITREEVAAVFFRLLEDSYRDKIRSNNAKYEDVELNRWSSKHIATLSNGKILQGYPGNIFRPQSTITRAEVAAIASRFDSLDVIEKRAFSDIRGHWAEQYINSAEAKGWVKGYSDGTFKPDNPITRAEFVTLVNNVLGRKVSKENILKGIKKFKDLDESEWYYEHMVEASNSHIYEKDRLSDGSEVWIDIIDIKTEM